MLKHTLLTWLATCFLGTGLLCVYIGLEEGGFKDPYAGALILLALGITLAASIPAMIIYGVMLDALLRSMSPPQAKGVCSGYAVIATVVTYS